MWYAIKAWNQETLYGWTEDPRIADAYCDYLNKGKDVSRYHAHPLTDEEAAELDLEERDDLVFTGDSAFDNSGELHLY